MTQLRAELEDLNIGRGRRRPARVCHSALQMCVFVVINSTCEIGVGAAMFQTLKYSRIGGLFFFLSTKDSFFLLWPILFSSVNLVFELLMF